MNESEGVETVKRTKMHIAQRLTKPIPAVPEQGSGDFLCVISQQPENWAQERNIVAQ